MALDPGFLQQQAWNGDWHVVVIRPHRQLDYGALTPCTRAQPCCSSPKAADPVAAEILGVLH